MSTEAKAANGRKTLVEEGTKFKGSLSSSCAVEVKGEIEGDVTAPALTVTTSGSVHGRVKVGEMQSHGQLAGEIDADSVQLSGTVKDNTVIRARSLEVKLAPADGKMQVIFGECQLEVGTEEKPRVEVGAEEKPRVEVGTEEKLRVEVGSEEKPRVEVGAEEKAKVSTAPLAESTAQQDKSSRAANVAPARSGAPPARASAPPETAAKTSSSPPELAKPASARPPAGPNGA